MNELVVLLIVAAVVEATWETLKPVWPRVLVDLEKEKGIAVDLIGSLLISVVICAAAGVDLMALVGINLQVPYLGSILTGILTARGSNFVHDLLNIINAVKRDKDSLKIEAGL
ncbi:MAG TPA: hypothetical protein PKO38_01935 [Bacillota bacterium]|jgi:hypothetical protein|nr:hypothetical protein [Bacillota bacterium]HOB86434.1 hypothetical protein [Bacillota bacterium]HOP69247.1 hypothetical protein [Bacillota bacterium]HPT34107.1 hypothetical protein [Bacillota bacterium]HPZ65591.1 hypothetical protein [Bacillota bacterium]